MSNSIYNERCFTENIPPECWADEIDALCRQYRSYGIDNILLGIELEFVFEQDLEKFFSQHTLALEGGTKIDGKGYARILDLSAEMSSALLQLIQLRIEDLQLDWNLHFSTQKAKFLSELEEERQRADTQGAKDALAAKIEQVAAFSAPELLMYELHEKNEATQAILGYAFGKGLYGRGGYYDNPHTLEARLQHCAPRELLDNHNILMAELERLRQAYGLSVLIKPVRHISISFWKGEQNLMDTEAPEHLTTGRQIAEGITRGVYDGGIMIHDPENRVHLTAVSLGSHRSDILRLAKGRAELRLMNNVTQHPEALVVVMLAGGLYGINLHARGGDALLRIVPAETIVRPVLEHDRNSSDFIALCGYFKTCKGADENSMRPIDLRATDGVELIKIFMELGFLEEGSQEFSLLVRAKKSDPGLSEAEQQTADLIKDYLTRLIAMMLSEVAFERDGVIFPAPLKELQEKIHFKGVVRTFEIDPIDPAFPAYTYFSLTRTPEFPTAGHGVYRFMQSDALRSTLSPSLFAAIGREAVAAFGHPKETEKMSVRALNNDIVKRAARDRGLEGSLALGPR